MAVNRSRRCRPAASRMRSRPLDIQLIRLRVRGCGDLFGVSFGYVPSLHHLRRDKRSTDGLYSRHEGRAPSKKSMKLEAASSEKGCYRERLLLRLHFLNFSGLRVRFRVVFGHELTCDRGASSRSTRFGHVALLRKCSRMDGLTRSFPKTMILMPILHADKSRQIYFQ